MTKRKQTQPKRKHHGFDFPCDVGVKLRRMKRHLMSNTRRSALSEKDRQSVATTEESSGENQMDETIVVGVKEHSPTAENLKTGSPTHHRGRKFKPCANGDGIPDAETNSVNCSDDRDESSFESAESCGEGSKEGCSQELSPVEQDLAVSDDGTSPHSSRSELTAFRECDEHRKCEVVDSLNKPAANTEEAADVGKTMHSHKSPVHFIDKCRMEEETDWELSRKTAVKSDVSLQHLPPSCSVIASNCFTAKERNNSCNSKFGAAVNSCTGRADVIMTKTRARATVRPVVSRFIGPSNDKSCLLPTSLPSQDSPNFVKKLESFVASVNNRCGENSHGNVNGNSNLSLELSHAIAFQDQQTAKGLLGPCKSVTYANGSGEGGDQPLDLSFKPHMDLGICGAQTEYLNGEICISNEISSLARLEEKFGANSAILNQIGVRPQPKLLFSGMPNGSSMHRISSPKRLSHTAVFPDRCLSMSNDRTNTAMNGSAFADRASPLCGTGTHHVDYRTVKSLAIQNKSTDKTRNVGTAHGLYSRVQTYDNLSSIEAVSRKATSSVPLRCSCGYTSDVLSQLHCHFQESGHSLFVEPGNGNASPPGTAYWTKHGHQSKQHFVWPCIECGRSFPSVLELTLHMIQTAHYLNLVQSNTISHRPSSVCSASSTLDSYDGNENNSIVEHVGYDAARAQKIKMHSYSDVPVSAHKLDHFWNGLTGERLLSGIKQSGKINNKGHKRLSNCRTGNASKKMSQQDKQRSENNCGVRSSDTCNPSPRLNRQIPESVKLKEDSLYSDVSSESQGMHTDNSPIIRNEAVHETRKETAGKFSVHGKTRVNMETERKLQNLANAAATSSNCTSALVAMQDFVQRSFSHNIGNSYTKSNSFHEKHSVSSHLASGIGSQFPNFSNHWRNNALAPDKLRKQTNSSRQTLHTSDNSAEACSSNTCIPRRRKGTFKHKNLPNCDDVSSDGSKNFATNESTHKLQRMSQREFKTSVFHSVFASDSSVLRPSSVDDVLLAKSRNNVSESAGVRQRRSSSDTLLLNRISGND